MYQLGSEPWCSVALVAHSVELYGTRIDPRSRPFHLRYLEMEAGFTGTNDRWSRGRSQRVLPWNDRPSADRVDFDSRALKVQTHLANGSNQDCVPRGLVLQNGNTLPKTKNLRGASFPCGHKTTPQAEVVRRYQTEPSYSGCRDGMVLDDGTP